MSAVHHRGRRNPFGTAFVLAALLMGFLQFTFVSIFGGKSDPLFARWALAGVVSSQRFSRFLSVKSYTALPDDIDEIYQQTSSARISPENSRGNVEYKLKLSASQGTPRFEELVSQLNWRMRECNSHLTPLAPSNCITQGSQTTLEGISPYGEALYHVGVKDDGLVVGLDDEEMDQSLAALNAMAACMNAVATVVSRRTGIPPGNRSTATVLIRAVTGHHLNDASRHEVRICTVGNVDSGKSTLLGVLTRGLQDDGRGKARSLVFRHRHELESGRTSSISNMLLGFDESGQVLNYHEDAQGIFRREDPEHMVGHLEDSSQVVQRASKLIAFFDLCGHERYFKTTLVGLVGLSPDYLLCTIDTKRGEMRGMVHEHLMVANALSIPTVVCLTKLDMATRQSVESILLDVKRFLKRLGSPAFVIRDRKDVVVAAERVLQGHTPVILCSAVTGVMIPELKLFLNLLKKRTHAIAADNPDALMLTVEDVFPQVPGVGMVVSGRLVRGHVSVGDIVRVGPVGDTKSVAKDGFIDVRISSIYFQGMPVDRMEAGAAGTFALKAMGKARSFLADSPGLITKGKVLIGKKSDLKASPLVKARVRILQHPSSIRVGYEPVLQVGMVRQAAKILAMETVDTGEQVQTLRAGETAEITFQWKRWPELVEVGSPLVLRENFCKGVGSISWVGGHSSETPKSAQHKPSQKRKNQRKSKRRSKPESPQTVSQRGVRNKATKNPRQYMRA